MGPLGVAAMLLFGSLTAPGKPPGYWPTPRQNRHLTAGQPLAGRMRSTPETVARLDFGRTPGQLHAFASRPGGAEDRVATIAGGRLRCYRLDGVLVCSCLVLAAQADVARLEGVFCEPASAAGVAGLRQLTEAGRLERSGTVVCILTGHGLKDPDAAPGELGDLRPVPPTTEAIRQALGR